LGTKSRRISSALAAAAALLAVTAPSPATARLAPPSPDTDPVRVPLNPRPPVAPSAAQVVHSRMSLAQRVGQLFMVGTEASSADAATLSQISRYHVGNVMLTGRSYGGTRAPSRVAAELQARATRAATEGVRLLVSTDQEGGAVQVLHGPGISDMPAALTTKGRWNRVQLRNHAENWARQLREAGVNMNLAPVLDTVPGPTAARRNPPIGGYQRQFGYTPAVVASHGTAFARGMAASGVLPTIKHFPGLGRVGGNTDVSSDVTDRVTRRGDAYLRPFQAAVDAGVPFVMMSTAYYSRMDARNPAAFSSFIIRRILRGDLGFRGVVISDDLSNARQVARWSPRARAIKFIGAGGDMVLTVSPATLPAMYDAVLHRARHNPAFRGKVDRAALRVLRVKEDRHLLGRQAVRSVEQSGSMTHKG
jgi:beta-N-acetylhexosaminidase